MKRLFIFLLLLLLALTVFSGCRQQKTAPLCRVVTQVDITCQQQDLQIHRRYTALPKIEAVLIYLRLLKPRGVPAENPLALGKEVFQITLHLSDGSRHIYQQTAHRYLKDRNGPWKKIDPAKAAGLYALMRELPSD